LPVTRDLDFNVPLLAFQRFLTMPIAIVAVGISLACMLGVAQVALQFRLQAPFDHRFGQFFEQSSFAQDVPLASRTL
jgi:hypothetical protein